MLTPLRSVAIVVEDRPILRLNVDGTTVDYELRRGQLLLLAQQALAAFQQDDRMTTPAHTPG
jgi:hypothetical protein